MHVLHKGNPQVFLPQHIHFELENTIEKAVKTIPYALFFALKKYCLNILSIQYKYLEQYDKKSKIKSSFI